MTLQTPASRSRWIGKRCGCDTLWRHIDGLLGHHNIVDITKERIGIRLEKAPSRLSNPNPSPLNEAASMGAGGGADRLAFGFGFGFGLAAGGGFGGA